MTSFQTYLTEGMDVVKLKQLSTSSPDAATATMSVLTAILANPKANKTTLINKIAAEHKTSASKINAIIIAMGMDLELKPHAETESVKEAEDLPRVEDTKESESMVEDWVPMSRNIANKAQKIKTKKSGANYFYIVSTDTKNQKFYVVTPKQYNNEDTDNPMTVSFADVVMVSTDDMAEGPEKGGKVASGVTKHTAKYGSEKDED